MTMTSTATPMADVQALVQLPPHWMVCTAAAIPCLEPGRARRPGGVQHAREMGTLTTRCGKPAVNWVNFYDLPFDSAHPDACPDCAVR